MAALLGGTGSYFLAVRLPGDTPRASTQAPVFTESKWPFPIDEWGEGWAYQCKAADCGTEVNLYLRPKIGFCNCQTGVADDAELDRVSDLDLIGGGRMALDPGEPITVQGMKGRSRAYKVAASPKAEFAKSALSLAFNNRCDVVVATVMAGDQPLAQEQAVLDFLNGELMHKWTEQMLGL
jgi:hypothetical protein